jgi:DNA-binding transcriptional MerR regulator
MADPLLALRDYAKLAPWNIRDLSTIAGGILDASGITPINAAAQSHPSDRTIRFYVTRKLMSAPDGRGTAATYSYRHLLQLLAIKLRQMEGATLVTIEKELADSPGDVLEKRVAASLGTVPAADELMARAHGAPRGRVARLLAANRENAPPAAGPAGDPAPARGAALAVPRDSGAWFRVGIGDGLEVAMRADHPAARNSDVRARVAAAVARVLADSAEESAS